MVALTGVLVWNASQIAQAKIGDSSDDNIVLVPGVRASDYSDGKRAKNGFVRATLTQGNADYYIEMFEHIYQITLSSEERDEFQRRFVAAWPDGKYETDMPPGAFKVLQETVQLDAGAFIYNTDKWHSIITRRAMLIKLQSLAKEDRVNGPFLLGLYNKHNRPLAAGNPPLTRKTTDALASRMVFMINEVMGKKAATETPQLRDKIARQTATLWPRMSRVQRQKLIDLEQSWEYFQSRTWSYTIEYSAQRILRYPFKNA